MKKRFLCTLLAAVLLMGTVSGAFPLAKAQTELHTSPAMLDLIAEFEGFRGECYQDGSQRSVGYGTKCEYCDPRQPGYPLAGPCAVYTKENPISKEYAKERMLQELAVFEQELYDFAARHGLTYTQNQFDALVSLSYNCGGNWRNEQNGILRNAVISGDMGDYLVYAFGLYSKSKGTVSLGHLKRRMVEAQVYLYGVYNNDWPENLRYVYLDGNGGETRYYHQAFDAASVCPIRAELTAVPKGPDGKDLAFAGWFTKPEGGMQVENLTAALTNGTVLYAHWKNEAGETVTVNTDTSTPVDVTVVVPNWSPDKIYEHPGTYYSVVRGTTLNEQLHITKTVTGKDGKQWGFCGDGWIPLSDTNYSDVTNTVKPDGICYEVKASALNVRTGPGTNYAFANGATAKVRGEKVWIVKTEENPDGDRTWGQMSDGNWICVRQGASVYAAVLDPQPDYSAPTPVAGVTVTAITISALPSVLEYPIGGLDVLPDLTGAQITIHYSNGRKEDTAITRSMVSGFDNSQLGVIPITVTCGGRTAMFEVEIIPKVISGIAIHTGPDKSNYLYMNENLDLTGASLKVFYERENITRIVPITADMVTGFNNTVEGINTLTVTYGGFTVSMDVNIVNPVITFLNYDGSILSQAQYALGAAVTPPAAPVRPEDAQGEYAFIGWDREVVPCEGTATYTAVFVLCHTVTFLNYDGSLISVAQYAPGAPINIPADPVKPADAMGEYDFAGWDQEVVNCAGKAAYTATFKLRYAPGDLNRDNVLDENDAIYLLWHVFFPQEYPIYAWADFDRNNAVDENDAIYLLWHVFFPQEYPLS